MAVSKLIIYGLTKIGGAYYDSVKPVKVATIQPDESKKVVVRTDGVWVDVDGNPYARVFYDPDATFVPLKKRGGGVGYIKKADFDALNVSTVSIPANFAGLEAVAVPPRLQEQLFRIVEVVENEDYVEVTARHVWYDNLKNYTLWQPNNETDYTAAAVCRNILTNAISTVASRVASDCTDTRKGDQLDYKNKNLVEAFLDPENGVCAKFGLSLIRYNWDFYCLKEVGYNRGFVVENGKNMLGVERTESIENLATRVAPYGKDSKGDIVWLNNNGLKYVDSQYIGDYSCPHVELLDTGLTIGKDGVTAENIQTKLLEAAQKRFSDDHVDLPEVEMTIEFLSLGDTEEYSQYRGLDKVYLYDIITVKDTVRGYNYTAQVIEVEHDILTGMLNSVTIGKLDNWDGTRKIATWQVPEVNGENIRLKSILAGSFAPGAIGSLDLQAEIIQYAHIATATIDSLTSDSITAVTAQIHEIIAGSITADDITAGSITADRIKSHDITADQIAAGSITADRIKSHDITADQIEAGSITADRIKSHDITANQIAAETITSNELHAGAVTAGKIDAGAVTAEKIDAGAVTAVKIAAGAVNADKIAAGAITAGKIDTNDLTAINATLGTASIADAQISVADINFAHIKDLSAGSAYFGQTVFQEAVGGKLYVPRLAVGYAQMLSATISDLVIQASNNLFYKLDVNASTGAVTATQMTPTAQEIENGYTSDGRTIYMGTDILATDLNTQNIYASHALMDQITANIINVDKLFAREATIAKINATDLSSNTYIQSVVGDWVSGSTITQTINSINTRITSLGYGTFFYSETEPDHQGLVAGDVWIKPIDDNTWDDIAEMTWDQVATMTWDDVLGKYEMYAWTGTRWKLLYDSRISSDLQTQINQNAYAITLKADETVVDALSDDVTEFAGTLEVQAEAITSAVSAVNAKSSNYVRSTDPADDQTITLKLGDTWTKTVGNGLGTWNSISGLTWNQIGAYTWDEIGGAKTFAWNGAEWIPVVDRGMVLTHNSEIRQTAEAIEAEVRSRMELDNTVTTLSSRLTMTDSKIETEVQRAQTAENTKIAKTSLYQTADSIVAAAHNYVDGILTDESVISQTATGITAYVSHYVGDELNGYYEHRSGIDIIPDGIEISGAKYVKIKSGGKFETDSQNFRIDASGNVTVRGTITAGAESVIGGWTLLANRFYSGSGSSYVALDSNPSGTYAIWAGNATASSAPFWVKRNGEAKFSGTVTAVSGSIGGWTLATNRLSSGSGTSYVALDSDPNGTYAIWAGNATAANASFWVKRNGQAKFAGVITAASGSTLGGWTLGSTNLHSGSGTNYIALASSGTYALWAGAENSSGAPFRLKPDGTVYLTKLIAVGENGSESEVNLRTANLWKLNYYTIKNYSTRDGFCSSITLSNGTVVNFNRAADVTLTGEWISNTTFRVTENSSGKKRDETLACDWRAVAADSPTITVNSFNSSHKASAYVTAQSYGGGNGAIFKILIDANGEYTDGWNTGSNWVYLTQGGWVSGKNVVSASNGKTTTVNMPTITLSGGTSFSSHKTTVYASGGGASGYLASLEVDASSEYSAGQTNGANGVTLTQGGWLNGTNVVRASNGKQTTVTIPPITLSGGTTFSSHKTTVYAAGGGYSGYLANLEVDATSEYNSGNSAGYTSGKNDWKPTGVSLGSNVSGTQQYTIPVAIGSGSHEDFVLNLQSVYNAGWNAALDAATKVDRYTTSTGSYGGGTTHYYKDGNNYISCGSGWYQRSYDNACYHLPDRKT